MYLYLLNECWYYDACYTRFAGIVGAIPRGRPGRLDNAFVLVVNVMR